jgi:predicted nucleic acid-binding protein
LIVVSNATPLIALAKLDRLALLQDLFGTIHIPQAVHDEVVVEAPERPGAARIREAEWIHVHKPANRAKINYLRADLDPGEAEVLILAEELKADWVLLDESRARVAAELLELRFTGTIGILLLAKRMDKIRAIRPLLDELRAKRFHLSERVYEAVLEQAGE